MGLLFSIQQNTHVTREVFNFIRLLQQLDTPVKNTAMHDAAFAESGRHEYPQTRASFLQLLNELRTEHPSRQHDI